MDRGKASQESRWCYSTQIIIDLVVRFGIPHSIITDNGTNFAHGELKEYCHEEGIRLDLAFVSHSQSNGQVKRANAVILGGIKTHLEAPLRRAAEAWVEELPSVLWSLRTTPNRSTGFTPFFLVYGPEAIIPADNEYDPPRHALYTQEEAKKAREDDVDLKEEACLLALSRSAVYQQK